MGVIEVRNDLFATPIGVFAVGGVGVQFSFKHEKSVPEILRSLEEDSETVEERLLRKSVNNGYLVFDYAANVDASDLPAILAKIGFAMAGAFYQRRPDAKRGKQYSTVRFTFCRPDIVNADVPEAIKDAMNSMFSGTIWRMRGYINPVCNKKGEAIPGEFKAMICFEARTPLSHDGKPVMVYDRDADGERVEGSGRPLKADRRLVMDGNRIILTTC